MSDMCKVYEVWVWTTASPIIFIWCEGIFTVYIAKKSVADSWGQYHLEMSKNMGPILNCYGTMGWCKNKKNKDYLNNMSCSLEHVLILYSLHSGYSVV